MNASTQREQSFVAAAAFLFNALGGRYYPIDEDKPVVWYIKFKDGAVIEAETPEDAVAKGHVYRISVARLTGEFP